MIEAMIQTGAYETPYRRAGAGAPVLMLIGGAAAATADQLFPRLAERFRVILPDTSGTPAAPEDWLQGIIDGLGLQTPAIVADASFAPALLRFAMLDPGRVGRLAILDTAGAAGRPARAGAGAALDALSVAGHPLLVARLPVDPASPATDALVRELSDFLAGTSGQPAPRSVS